MYRMARYVARHLLPAKLRNRLDLFSSLREGMHRPEPVEKPEGSRPLVLAPHPDDETLGCGGTLHKHHRAGDALCCVFMTDGSKGVPGSGGPDAAAIRRQEAEAAAEVIGIDRLVFLENPDGELAASEPTVSEVAKLVQEVKPDLIYLPFLLDYHPDHWATNAVLLAALESVGRRVMLYAYEVWTPLVPNRAVDIAAELDVKRKAIEQFRSQLEKSNLVDAAVGFAKYRAVTGLLTDSYAEGFFRCDSEEYARLWQMIKW